MTTISADGCIINPSSSKPWTSTPASVPQAAVNASTVPTMTADECGQPVAVMLMSLTRVPLKTFWSSCPAVYTGLVVELFKATIADGTRTGCERLKLTGAYRSQP